MNKTVKNMLLVIGEHLLFVVLSFFLVSTFLQLLRHHLYILSIITGVFYISSTYSAGWSLSKKDYAAAKEAARIADDESLISLYKRYNGFIIALPNLVISMVLFFAGLSGNITWYFIYELYNYSFLYAMLDASKNLIVPLAVLFAVLPYFAYGVGYVMGKNKKVLFIKYLPKILYKNPNKD